MATMPCAGRNRPGSSTAPPGNEAKKKKAGAALDRTHHQRGCHLVAPAESVSPSPRDKDRERQPENRERELDIEEISAISHSSDQVLGAAYPMAGSEGGIMQRLIVGRHTATQLGGERLGEFRPEL